MWKPTKVVGGSSGIPSLARSLLVRRRIPVAVFMDADSLDPQRVAERRDSTEELIRAAAASVPVKVVVAVPELETYFFAAPEVMGPTDIERIRAAPAIQELSVFLQSLPQAEPVATRSG